MSFKSITLAEFFNTPENFEMAAHPHTIWGQSISYFLVEGQPRIVLFENSKTAYSSNDFSGSLDSAVAEIICANGA